MNEEGRVKKEDNDLRVRTKEFALRVIRLFGTLPKNTEAQILGRQVLRSGTSVGANYREAYRALKRISLLKNEVEISAPTNQEIAETQALLKNYEYFFEAIAPEGAMIFRPRIRGVGVLNEIEGDFCTNKTLYEVKGVNRNIQGGDLRQILCYLVAGLGSRQFSWTKQYFQPTLSCLIYKSHRRLAYLSVRTAPECITDVMDALMEREQPLEFHF